MDPRLMPSFINFTHSEVTNITLAVPISKSNGSFDPSTFEMDDQMLGSSIDDNLASFINAIDVCLAFFSGLNLMVNVCLLILCVGFVRNGCMSKSDSSGRRPHYGLHLFILNCAITSVMLEAIGSLTNIAFLIVGQNIFTMGVESSYHQYIIRKTLDFVTYGLFNVTHLNFVLLLNVDKLFYIIRPLHYHQIMSRRRVCMICIGTWIAALAMASPSLTHVDANAQLRQEAILFAMCVVCPASFDLLSAVIVAAIVYRIQLKDTITTRALLAAHRNHTDSSTGALINTSPERKTPSRLAEDVIRRCNVFLRTFTPIIWTCITTLPYTTTMIYLYFWSDGDEDFIRRWTDDTTFRVLRAFGCLYITYFTGVPLILIFNYYPYRQKIKTLSRILCKRVHAFRKRIFIHVRYQSVSTKHEIEVVTGANTSILQDGGYIRNAATVL